MPRTHSAPQPHRWRRPHLNLNSNDHRIEAPTEQKAAASRARARRAATRRAAAQRELGVRSALSAAARRLHGRGGQRVGVSRQLPAGRLARSSLELQDLHAQRAARRHRWLVLLVLLVIALLLFLVVVVVVVAVACQRARACQCRWCLWRCR